MSPLGGRETVTDLDKTIESVAKKADIDESDVRDRIDEKLEEMKSHQTSAMSEDDLRGHAVSIVKNDLLNITGGSGFGGGETEELSILSLGYQRKDGDYFVTDGNALVALGIVKPTDDPAGVAVFLLDAEHGVDLTHAADAFQPLNTIKGFAARRVIGSRDGEPKIKKGGQPTYLVNSTGQSKFEVVDPSDADDSDPISELPGDREAKRDLIHEHFITEDDHVTLQNYAEHTSMVNNNGYEVAFGIDVKRFRGEVVDVYSNEDSDFAVMTLMDDTVFDEDDVDEELIGDKMRTPGLQVMGLAPELVQYGKNSILDVYGFIDQKDDGQYLMRGMGVIPIVEFEYDGPSGNGSSGTDTDDNAEVDTI